MKTFTKGAVCNEFFDTGIRHGGGSGPQFVSDFAVFSQQSGAGGGQAGR